jgi:hypothetical protein
LYEPTLWAMCVERALNKVQQARGGFRLETV